VTGSLVRTHRLGGGWLLSWLVFVVAIAAGVQSLIGGEGTARVGAFLVCVAVACATYLLGMRPRVTELPTDIEVVNPLRTARIAWSSVTDVDVTDVVRIHAGAIVVRCFALPRRDRRPVVSGLASTFGGRPLPDDKPTRSGHTTSDVVGALRARVDVSGPATGATQSGLAFAPVAVAVLALGAVAAVAAILVLVLG